MNKRIKELRKSTGLTQQAFANRLGIKQNTIAKYETGRGNPTTAVISLICREFNVNEDWLRTGSGDMFMPPLHSTLDTLAMEYHLSEGACALIQRFLELDDDIQQAFVDYAVKVANDLSKKVEQPEDKATAELHRIYSQLTPAGQDVLLKQARFLTTEVQYSARFQTQQKKTG